MKKLISILLLFILAINIVSFVFVFEIKQYTIKKEVAKTLYKYIPSSKVTVITISPLNKNNIVWKDKNEFSYNGLMYDVINSEVLNNGAKQIMKALSIKEMPDLIPARVINQYL